jgi:hypothetical protein
MATAAAEPEVVEEPKKKKPILLIIGGVVGLIVLIVGVVLGTLFLTGYFNPKPVVAMALVTKKGMASQARKPKMRLS